MDAGCITILNRIRNNLFETLTFIENPINKLSFKNFMPQIEEIALHNSYKEILPSVALTVAQPLVRIYIKCEQLEEMLKGCKRNERLAQKELYHNYYNYAMSIALRYSSTYDSSIEMINDAFLKVFKSIQTFEPRHGNTVASFTAWLKKILIYSCIDHIRKYNKKEMIGLVDTEQITMADHCETAEQMLQHKEIITSIQHLSPAYKAVFNLYVIEGFSHAEIAEKLNISEGASKSNLHKARQNLRHLLEESNAINYAGAL